MPFTIPAVPPAVPPPPRNHVFIFHFDSDAELFDSDAELFVYISYYNVFCKQFYQDEFFFFGILFGAAGMNI